MRDWWSPAEIAEAGLPDLPGTARGVAEQITRDGWRSHREHARRRSGKGGGWEYHRALFPARAQAQLIRLENGTAEADSETATSRDALWRAFDALPERAKAKARKALDIVAGVDRLRSGGLTLHQAVTAQAASGAVGKRTIFNWLSAIKGVPVEDRLPHLAPKHRSANRKSRRAGIDADAWAFVKDFYLRPGEITFTSCYEALQHQAEAHGWTIPSEASLRRRIKAEIPADLKVLSRKGQRALTALYPAQVRDKTSMVAMECVNADYHKWDVFVRDPDGTMYRPQMCAFADIHSAKLLSWRFDRTANSSTVRLAFGDMLERYGVPQHCVLDNGREFASKQVTGKVTQRFRGKVLDDEIDGFMPALGIQVHWATPYSGQSKPIERAFRDLCSNIAKDPRFVGAYCGNAPDAKPEDFTGTPVDLDYFIAIVNEGIARHNARPGRRSEVAQGRSLDQVFAESYATARITKVTDAQRRYFLLGAEKLRANRDNGEVKLMGNKYWSPWILAHAGESLIGRFDPDDLQAGLHVYGSDGAYLGMAECHEKAGFLDVDSARTHGRARRQFTKGVKELKEAERILGGAHAAELMDRLSAQSAPAEPDVPDARIIRPRFDLRDAPRPEAVPLTEDEARLQASIIHAFERPSQETEETHPEVERFRMARRLEAEIAKGDVVSADDRAWLHGYQNTAEYRGIAMMAEEFDDFGEDTSSA